MARKWKKSHAFPTKSNPNTKYSETSRRNKSILQPAPLSDHDANSDNDGLVERTVVTEASVFQTDDFPCQKEATKDVEIPENELILSVASTMIAMSQLTVTSSLTPLHSDKSITEADSLGISALIDHPDYVKSSFLENSNDGDILIVEEETIGIEHLSIAQDQIGDTEASLDTKNYDYLRIYNALAFVSRPTPPPGKDVGGGDANIATLLENSAMRDLESREPNKLESDASITLRSSSESSRVSASSTDFHIDNTFLGSTSARDLLDHATSEFNGVIPRKALASAFIRCVADEHADRRAASPGVHAPGVAFITEKDVDQCMSFETQRRAKLGYISLFKFLRMIEFDDAAMATETDILDAWRKAALESRDLTELAKNSPASRAARRISRSRSESEQSRGRPRVRLST
ncbi:hypothetical protein PTMSG1_04442 [Pyrenophora teres f. maculata]|nr:hypothetical protein PTMSG1_04442 [Pyrenophora teres f. maculata]